MTTISRTYAHNELELACHVRNPGSNSNITIDVDGTVYEFEVAPTIDWVASSTAAGANKILINILPNMDHKLVSLKKSQYQMQSVLDFLL
jgi:hypothetical protein